MKKQTSAFALIFFFTFGSSFALADNSTRGELVLRYMSLFSFDELWQKNIAATVKEMPPKEGERLEKILRSVDASELKALSMRSLRIFTNEELKYLVQFYETDIGRAMLAKMPQMLVNQQQEIRKLIFKAVRKSVEPKN